MEAHEIAEQIHEHAEPHAHAEPTRDWFRRITGIYVGVVAMLLAIAALGGSEATKEMLNANIHASDTYAFYQSKYIRQVLLQTAAEELELTAAASANLAPEQRARVDQLVKRYRDTAARYESEPATADGKGGEGKKELMARAQAMGAHARPCRRAVAEFRICRGAVPDRDRARLGRDRGGLALAARGERRAGGRRSGADDQRLPAARAVAARGHGASRGRRAGPGGDREAGGALRRAAALTHAVSWPDLAPHPSLSPQAGRGNPHRILRENNLEYDSWTSPPLTLSPLAGRGSG